MSNELKHTPGPWRSRTDGETITIDGDVNGAFYCGIAQINPGGNHEGGTPNRLDRANARLIAAATELKGLCLEAASAISHIECFLRSRGLLGEARASHKALNEPHAVVTEIYAAIAKVEGK
jgi:hypothetical protein